MQALTCIERSWCLLTCLLEVDCFLFLNNTKLIYLIYFTRFWRLFNFCYFFPMVFTDFTTYLQILVFLYLHIQNLFKYLKKNYKVTVYRLFGVKMRINFSSIKLLNFAKFICNGCKEHFCIILFLYLKTFSIHLESCCQFS